MSERSAQWRERQSAAQRKVQSEAAKRRWANPEYRERQRDGHRSPLGDAQRFWNLVTVGEPDACWPWKGSRGKSGHGKFTVDRYSEHAHRAAWKFAFGDLPAGVCVLHRCDNPPCCNPRHLFTGSRADNIRDMIVKGRDRKAHGAANGLAKLTDDQVREMRRLYAEGAYQRTLAKRFGISQGAVSAIVTRRTWRHVEDAKVGHSP